MEIRKIKVPTVSAKAYNAKRPASDLLRRQVAQLEHLVGRLPGYEVPMPAKRVKTEGQASTFITAITRALHPHLVRPSDEKPQPGELPLVAPAKPGTGRRRRSKPAARRTKPKPQRRAGAGSVRLKTGRAKK
jgi:hypothetical protein